MTTLIVRSAKCCGENRRLVAESRALAALSRRLLNPWWGISGGADDDRTPPFDSGRAHQTTDELQLERLVRYMLSRGALFALDGGQCWAGPATGKVCRVCGEAISSGTECEVAGPNGPLYAHLICHSIWYRESEERRSEDPATST